MSKRKKIIDDVNKVDKSKLIKIPLQRVDKDVKNLDWEVDGKITEVDRNRNYIMPKLSKKKKFYKFGFSERRNLNKNAEKSFMVTMLFPNGSCIEKVICTSKRTFKYDKKEYHLYTEESFFDLTLNLFRLFYSYENTSPVNREIIMLGEEAYFSVTPENLKPLLKMTYVSRLSGYIKDVDWKKIVIWGAVIIGIIYIFLRSQQGG